MENQTDFEVIPVQVVTGFLGSGKTSMLSQLLACESFGDTAVLVNEFGEVGLDHLLLSEVAPQTVLLKSGCICCTIRGELSDALRDLYSRRQRGEVPPFKRVVLETTGLAEPAPILSTLGADPVIHYHFQLAGVITVVDALNALTNHHQEPVWLEQISASDYLILSKTDLVSDKTAQEVKNLLTEINPFASLHLSSDQKLSINEIFGTGQYKEQLQQDIMLSTLFKTKSPSFLKPSPSLPDEQQFKHQHLSDIRSFCLDFDYQIDWTAFGLWLSMLLNRHGRNILRVKGLLNIAGFTAPIAIHGVQHVVHPPVHLPKWPNSDKRSCLVFITRELDPQAIEKSFLAIVNNL